MSVSEQALVGVEEIEVFVPGLVDPFLEREDGRRRVLGDGELQFIYQLVQIHQRGLPRGDTRG